MLNPFLNETTILYLFLGSSSEIVLVKTVSILFVKKDIRLASASDHRRTLQCCHPLLFQWASAVQCMHDHVVAGRQAAIAKDAITTQLRKRKSAHGQANCNYGRKEGN
jgi:hypothetical protein